MLLGLEAERVHVDTTGGHVLVMLERLHQVEITAIHGGETVVAVELDETSGDGVVTTLEGGGDEHAIGTTSGDTGHATGKVLDVAADVGSGDGGTTTISVLHAVGGGCLVGDIEVIGVVEVLSTEGSHGTINVSIGLHNPNQLLARMIEVHLNFVVHGGGGLVTCKLKLLDQIFVGYLCKPPTFIGIQINIIHKERGGLEVPDGHGGGVSCPVVSAPGTSPEALLGGAQLQVDLHLVVLQGDQGQSESGVAVEPELQGNVQSLALDHNIAAGLVLGGVHQGGDVTHHVGIAQLMTGGLGQLIPDLQPVAVVLIDTLPTDLDLHALHEHVAQPVQPTESLVVADNHVGQLHAQVGAVDQITIAGDSAGDLLVPGSSTVESLLDGLHREVGVTAVYAFTPF